MSGNNSNSGSSRPTTKINKDGLPVTPQNIKPPPVKPPKQSQQPKGKD